MAQQINDGRHLVSIVDRHSCSRHNAPKGIPCFLLRKSKGAGYYPAICNHRAVGAGANGKVTESSYQIKKRQSPKRAPAKS